MVLGRKTGGRVKGSRNKPKAPSPVSTDAATPVAAADASPAAAAGGGGALDDELFSNIKTRAARALPPYKLAPVDKLIPYANNARTHTPAQVAKIAGSIREFGFTNPILVDGRRGIIAGHGRLLAAQMLAMDKVPVIELSHLSAAQRRAYIIADNRLSEDGGWDDELLALELETLRDDGFDLALTGFADFELKGFLEDPEEPRIKVTEAKSAICPGCGHRFAL